MKELIKRLQMYLVKNKTEENKNNTNLESSFNLSKKLSMLYYQKIIKKCNFMMNEKDVALDENLINSFLLPEIIKIDNFNDLCQIVGYIRQKNICKWVSFEDNIVYFKNDYRNSQITVISYGDVNNLINDIQYYYSNFIYNVEYQEFYDYYLKYIKYTTHSYKTLKLMFIKLLNIVVINSKKSYEKIYIKELNQILIESYKKLKKYVNLPDYQYKINETKLNEFQFDNKLDLLFYTREDEIRFEITLDRLLYVSKLSNKKNNCFMTFIKNFANSTKKNLSDYLFRYYKKYSLVI